jgi:CMP-N,N'-diacetyllegionaminic acid synthase
MPSSLSVLGLVTARGGSKRLPGKNLRPFLGVPLIAHTLKAALDSHCMQRVIVSTDDPEIAAVSLEHGADVPFARPPHLASDSASSLDVIVDVLDQLLAREQVEPEVLVLLQPTSPLRTAQHIKAAFEVFAAHEREGAVLSVCEAKPPSWIYRLDAAGHLGLAVPDPKSIAALAHGDRYVLPNGAIYIARTSYFRAHGGFMGPSTVGYVMDAASSIDIDVEADFALAERLAMSAQRTT